MRTARNYTLADKDKDFYLGPATATKRVEIMESVPVQSIYGMTTYEQQGTGKFHMVPCSPKEIYK